MKILNQIQKELKAPKGQFNSFGKYKYRSCEDILEAVKPLLGEAILTVSDDIVTIGDRFYVKATATLLLKPESVSVSAFAREPLNKKGMDESQVTGAASSYARKYALNGLFCIDDTKDADTQNNTGNVSSPKKVSPAKPNKKQQLVLDEIFQKLCECESIPEGKAVDKIKVGAVIYASKGKYPDDIKTAGAIAAWLISHDKMNELCKEIENGNTSG